MTELERIWTEPGDGPTHARLWPGKPRALCTGEVTEDRHLSAEAPTDEDADVTCEACLKAIHAANRDRREVQ